MVKDMISLLNLKPNSEFEEKPKQEKAIKPWNVHRLRPQTKTGSVCNASTGGLPLKETPDLGKPPTKQNSIISNTTTSSTIAASNETTKFGTNSTNRERVML